MKHEIELGQVKSSMCVQPTAITQGDSKKGGQGACKGASPGDDGKSSKGGLQGPLRRSPRRPLEEW